VCSTVDLYLDKVQYDEQQEIYVFEAYKTVIYEEKNNFFLLYTQVLANTDLDYKFSQPEYSVKDKSNSDNVEIVYKLAERKSQFLKNLT
jgi:hypothetical protein